MVENSGFKINVSSLTFQVNQIIGQLICVPLAAQLFNKNESSPISFLYISTSLEVWNCNFGYHCFLTDTQK